jgi:signal recognition particle GTPase
MFENLSDKLALVFKKLKGHGKLSENNIEEGLKEVRMALLEADVHYRVVKKFIAEIKERALGREVMSSLTPGQQIIKIVNDELTRLMGSNHEALNLSSWFAGVRQDNDLRKNRCFFKRKRTKAVPGSGRCLPPCCHRSTQKAW